MRFSLGDADYEVSSERGRGQNCKKTVCVYPWLQPGPCRREFSLLTARGAGDLSVLCLSVRNGSEDCGMVSRLLEMNLGFYLSAEG